ncbi:uncharacterized protein F5Z01DRAFT_468701 [Emericellopsis atlantica]|uniref:Myb-like domain-containing protein n=1 Tax=Emericellopsis atlantica TaxID=2614577 RepID=A0A9P7ZDH8_9HYPO|nr:uncharacterized protein F5Z01DRAFT_468701 [Emericellopsis atlantica]KAG9249692.1 hypothetical protein F5Z01DRAFT_468701 [Emericellopsis atlantica]
MHPQAPPTHGQASENIRIDGECLPWSSSRSSAVPFIPQEHDAGQSCESRSRSSPGSDGLDCSDDAAPTSSSCPKAPEACSPLSSSWSVLQGQGTEMATGTPCENEAASPKHATGTSRRRSERPRRASKRNARSIGGYATSNPDTTADSNSDNDTGASTGSHDKTRSDDESYPSPGRGEGEQGAGSGVDEADDESDSPPTKRRKQSQAPTSTRRKRGRAALSVGTDVANSPARAGTCRSACGVPSPPSSHYSSRSSPPSHTGAKFQEWFLPNAKLKRITFGGGRTTFQLQFDWDPHVDGRRADSPSSNGLRAPTSRKGVRPRGDAASSTAYTRAENEFIIRLKEGQGRRSWATIHREFNDKFPVQRTKGSLQVHYCTKLKDRTAS